MAITYEDLVKANQDLKETDIKGKKYIDVAQRSKAFRKLFPQGRIITELISNENGVCIFRASVFTNEGEILATGTAYEKETSSYINKTSYIENCETSAVGRALGLAGFGLETSIASAEEVTNAIEQQEFLKAKIEKKYITTINALITQYAELKQGKTEELVKYYCIKYKVKAIEEMDNEQGITLMKELNNLVERSLKK